MCRPVPVVCCSWLESSNLLSASNVKLPLVISGPIACPDFIIRCRSLSAKVQCVQEGSYLWDSSQSDILYVAGPNFQRLPVCGFLKLKMALTQGIIIY